MLLTTRIGWIQCHDLQRLRTSSQQEPHPVHVEKTHVTKSDSPKEVNHFLQKVQLGEMRYPQPSPQGRDKGRDECRIFRWFLAITGLTVQEFEVLQVLK